MESGQQDYYDDVIRWKHFPRYWPFVRGIYRSLVNYPHKGQWCGALMFSLICAWINGWVNNREVGVFRRHRAHCDVTVMTNARFYLIVVRLLPSYRITCNICHDIWTQLYYTSFMFYCYCYHFVYYDYYYSYYWYHNHVIAPVLSCLVEINQPQQ